MNKTISKKELKFADYEYSPMRREFSSSTINAGLVARGAVISALTLGLCAFISDCFLLDVGFFVLLIFSLLWSAVFCALFCGGKASLFGAALGVVMLAVFAIISPGFGSYIVNCFKCTVTTAGNTFVKYGYDNLSFLKIGYVSYGSASSMNSGTMFLLTAVISLIISALNMRKVLMLPTVLFSFALCSLGFTYNLMNANWGFAFIILSLFSLFTVKVFEKCYVVKKEDRKNRAAMGGYLGGVTAVIALICILIPAAVSDGYWGKIPVISDPIDVARDVFTSVISGDMPNLQEMGVIKNMDDQNSRNVSVNVPQYSGRSMLTVKRKSSSNTPVYVRGWVAAPQFNGTTWFSPTNDQTDAYNTLLSQLSQAAGYGEIYSPDYMTEAFFELLYAPGEMFDPEIGYKNNPTLGFNANRTDISMELGTGTGNLLYLPSTSFVSNGLSAFEDTDSYDKKALQFYEGIMLTGWFNLDKSYSVTSVSPNFTSKGSSENFFTLIEYANTVKEFIRAEHNGETTCTYEAFAAFILSNPSLTDIDSIANTRTFFDRYSAMTNEEQEVIYQRYCVLEEAYTGHVNANYITPSGNTFVRNIAQKIRFEEDDTVHQKAIRVIQYIVSNYSYSLTPKAGTVAGRTDFEQFITETLEGYSTHIATLAVLVLRESGIPARYVEGYLAQGFNAEGDYYECGVSDSSAHAWVEIYYPGYGWLTYEPTRDFAKALYGTNIKIPGSNLPLTPGTDVKPSTPIIPDTPTDEPTDPSEPVRRVIPWGKILRITAVVAVIGVAIYFFIKTMKDKADYALYSRKKLLEEATYGADADEYPEISHQINAILLRMLTIGGFIPSKGELPSEYAARIDSDIPYFTDSTFSDIMALMQKQEFGQGLDNADLKAISEYTSAVWTGLYESMSKPKRFWYRYVTREC